ncbi:hypothetical protein CY34DRAFT_109449 [Suillus luteus UH-Slu-Lm8-n1]|uniref:Uncharacterized protein n=1 Tax=Suillus luteus UH-Slu-Lm8-n1 TaxID=930992 RepID=A0A0D0AQQ8_9AGAM|nr:hypothetical protein CY34DRAFT_109449 [Suillus luteus UH-Slu-Lm8-n1]
MSDLNSTLACDKPEHDSQGHLPIERVQRDHNGIPLDGQQNWAPAQHALRGPAANYFGGHKSYNHLPDPGDEEEEVMVPITGPRSLALEAHGMLNEIIAFQTAHLIQKFETLIFRLTSYLLSLFVATTLLRKPRAPLSILL